MILGALATRPFLQEAAMRTLYIGSTAGNSGKTMVTIGLAPALQAHGYSVGYFKPVGKQATTVDGKVVDADALFLRDVLRLAEPPDQLCPLVVTQDLLTKGLRGEVGDVLPRIRAAFDKIAAGKDVVLIGGAGTLADGSFWWTRTRTRSAWIASSSLASCSATSSWAWS
jgi:BioD-like phosphotransacetylase family protein